MMEDFSHSKDNNNEEQSLTEESVTEPPEIPSSSPEFTHRTMEYSTISSSSGESHQSASDQSSKNQSRVRFAEDPNIRRANFVVKADDAVKRTQMNNTVNRPRPGSAVFVPNLTPSTDNSQEEGVDIFLQRSPSDRTMSTLSVVSIQSRLRQGRNVPIDLDEIESETNDDQEQEFQDEIRPGESKRSYTESTDFGNRNQPGTLNSHVLRSLPEIAVATVVEEDDISPPEKRRSINLPLYALIALISGVAVISGLLVAFLMKNENNAPQPSSISTPNYLTYVTLNPFSLVFIAPEGSITDGQVIHNKTSNHLNNFFSRSFNEFQTIDLVVDVAQEQDSYRRRLTTVEKVTAVFSGMASFRDVQGTSSIDANQIESVVVKAFTGANANQYLKTIEVANFVPSGLCLYNGDGSILVLSDGYLDYLNNKANSQPKETTNIPTPAPVILPTPAPVNSPTVEFTPSPTNEPTASETPRPSFSPSNEPSRTPTTHPSNEPSRTPTTHPSNEPSRTPTTHHLNEPSNEPSKSPTTLITLRPTGVPTNMPTHAPTEVPTNMLTNVPTEVPTNMPTIAPTEAPTNMPTNAPTEAPTNMPTSEPTEAPTNMPTNAPTEAPTNMPTNAPTDSPTKLPSSKPSLRPSKHPTSQPTRQSVFLQTNRGNPRQSKSGCMFNIVTKSSGIVITGLEIEMNFNWEWAKVYIYTRDGSYVGHENSEDGWTLVNNSFYYIHFANGLGEFTPVPNLSPISIPANSVKGFYVTLPTNFGVVMGKDMPTASDENLDIVPGVSIGYSFNESTDNYSFSGGIHYRVQ